MEKSKWVWMPHPAHFICARDCEFSLATYVGEYIVSTIGEYLPDSEVREIFAKSRGVKLEGKGDYREADYRKKIGYEDLHAFGWKYETMVFQAEKGRKEEGCCPWVQVSGTGIDVGVYKTAAEATAGHMKACNKWSKKRAKK